MEFLKAFYALCFSLAELADFEGILDHIGGWGRYQTRLLVLLFPSTLFLSYVAYSPVLILHAPDHWCKPDPSLRANLTNLGELELKDLTVPIDVDGDGGGRSKCMQYDIKMGDVRHYANIAEYRYRKWEGDCSL